PMPVEVCEGVADPCAATEVVYPLAHRIESPIEITLPEHAGHARQPRREDESLEVLASGDGVGEDHQEARVPFHRPADVADQDQRPAAEPWTPTVQPHHLPDRKGRAACWAAPRRP